MKEKAAAIVTIFHASDMTSKGKREVAAWLRRQAKLLEQHAKELAGRYTARYLYK